MRVVAIFLSVRLKLFLEVSALHGVFKSNVAYGLTACGPLLLVAMV